MRVNSFIKCFDECFDIWETLALFALITSVTGANHLPKVNCRSISFKTLSCHIFHLSHALLIFYVIPDQASY